MEREFFKQKRMSDPEDETPRESQEANTPFNIIPPKEVQRFPSGDLRRWRKHIMTNKMYFLLAGAAQNKAQ